jgi:hypothetical protein
MTNTTDTNTPKIKHRTVTLTGRPPVRIREDQWPVIAADRWWNGEIECQANRSGWLKVRRHEDGRTIVYGGYVTRWQGESDRRGGELLAAATGQEIADAIHRVASDLNAESIAESTIAELPAEEI